MNDRRYGSKEWRRLPLQVLDAYGHACQIRGERCTGRATTVDHVTPVSQGAAFWAWTNLRAACAACSFGSGNRIARENARATIEHLHAVIGERDERIAELTARLARYENGDGEPVKHRARRPGRRTSPRTGYDDGAARSTTSAPARSPKSPSCWATRSGSPKRTTSTR